MNSDNTTQFHRTEAMPARTSLASAVGQALTELRLVVQGLSAEQYCLGMGDAFRGASLGGHVRHVLDHIAPIVDLAVSRRISYDQRARGTAVERDLIAAGAELDRVIGLVARSGRLPVGSIEVLVLAGAGGPEVSTTSSIDRELAFALSHTIHHCSTMRSMLHKLGAAVPETFGYAPSTLAHQQATATVQVKGSTSCAR